MISFRAMSLAAIIGLPAHVTRAVIGMVHLRALPGSPRWDGDMAAVVRAALDDARALAEGGADAIVTRPIGINVLKNDVRSALAVAAATGARFVRVNVHVGAVAADQGIIQSEAHDSLRYRRLLDVPVAIFADVQAKHGMPLAPVPIEHEARDCYARGLADALVVSGVATGEPTPMSDLKRVRGAVPEAPLLVGSGASPETVGELLSVADGVIVGTSLKRDGRLANPVDVERVRRLVAAARAARG
jgi:membrane complex biogenesis BtpA family protein